ncbi:MAG TPA: methyltransferase domain-containing protein [Verrucomicrobiae bacterium]|jgi:SAM-dependent methyltransferase|nr:methyltransferase domain-containing protein [Verrucomicrobiae bacterium]
MVRSLHREFVDELPPEHPGAIQTRRDLRRLNTLMGHAGIITRSLKKAFPNQPASRMVEIGAGDGEVLLRVARRLAPSWHDVDVTFVDFHELLRDKTKADFAALSWGVHSVKGDIFQWLNDTAGEKTDVVIGNLVLHHFSDAQLTNLFEEAAKKASAFIAVEPRRSRWPLFCTNYLSVIGCNPITCHDAPVSVRAGFIGRELSALWPVDGQWELVERRAGLFSHLFVARRKI